MRASKGRDRTGLSSTSVHRAGNKNLWFLICTPTDAHWFWLEKIHISLLSKFILVPFFSLYFELTGILCLYFHVSLQVHSPLVIFFFFFFCPQFKWTRKTTSASTDSFNYSIMWLPKTPASCPMHGGKKKRLCAAQYSFFNYIIKLQAVLAGRAQKAQQSLNTRARKWRGPRAGTRTKL